MTLTDNLQQLQKAIELKLPKSVIKTFEDGIQEVRANGLKEKALKVGDTIPEFSLTNIKGESFSLEDVTPSEYLVLNFYRGGWCPYCNLELKEYEGLQGDFEKAGANIIAISAETPEVAAQTTDKNTISYPILTDKGAAFMKKVGIVFSIDEQSKKEYAGFGMDFTKIHGNENYELSIPAVYVINKNREIVFVHFEADYKKRIEPNEVLNSITMLKK